MPPPEAPRGIVTTVIAAPASTTPQATSRRGAAMTQTKHAQGEIRLICTLIRVDCLVTADAPNGLIGIGQRLGALIPGVVARRELP